MTCLHRHGISKGASLDQNSVNAVLLDVDGSSFDQLLVAAQVNVNASGDRLSLRRFVLCPPFYFISNEIPAFLAPAGFLEDLGLVLLQL